MKIQVGTPFQEQDIDKGEAFLAVPFQILDESGAVLQDRSQAFPLTATKEEIVEFLNKTLTTYQENVALHEGAKEAQAGIDNATVVAGEITGIEITA